MRLLTTTITHRNQASVVNHTQDVRVYSWLLCGLSVAVTTWEIALSLKLTGLVKHFDTSKTVNDKYHSTAVDSDVSWNEKLVRIRPDAA